MVRLCSALFIAALAAALIARTSVSRAQAPASGAPLLYNAAFTETVDGMPAGWIAFAGGVSVEAGFGGGAVRVGVGALGINWLVQSIPVQVPGYDIGVRSGGDAVAGLRVAWYATDDSSGAPLGSIDATERTRAPFGLAPITLTTGPFAVPGIGRSLRVYLLVQGPSAAEAVFAGLTIRAVADPPLSPSQGASAALELTPHRSNARPLRAVPRPRRRVQHRKYSACAFPLPYRQVLAAGGAPLAPR